MSSQVTTFHLIMKCKGLRWVLGFDGRGERNKDLGFVVNYNGR